MPLRQITFLLLLPSLLMCKIAYPTYSVEAVANHILNYGHKHGIEITNLKLQKLVYFAQGFALAKLSHPLFTEEIQAWTYGPVIPALYEKAKEYGNTPIRGSIAAPDSITPGSEEAEVIDEMMEMIGTAPATRLVSLSHEPNTPWAAAWAQGKYAKIKLWQMVVYFTDMLAPVA